MSRCSPAVRLAKFLGFAMMTTRSGLHKTSSSSPDDNFMACRASSGTTIWYLLLSLTLVATAVCSNVVKRYANITLHLQYLLGKALSALRIHRTRSHHGRHYPEQSARKLETLERSVATLDAGMRRQFAEVYGAILALMGPAATEQ